jgi:flagellar biosynthetic protein FliP
MASNSFCSITQGINSLASPVPHQGALSRLTQALWHPARRGSPCLKPALLLALLGLLALPFLAHAQQGLPAFTSTPGPGGSQTYSLSLQTLIFMTALTFIPAALLMMTSFTRIVIVLSLLRQALGTQTAPPNQVLIGLALFLTLFVMGPVLDRVYADAYQPLAENKIGMQQALERGAVPFKEFMLKQTRQSDLALYVKLSNGPALNGPEDVPLRVLVPAFITSELKTAFQISFAIFIPFLIIDMVVASILMSMGMMMMSPAIVALPFKLMLFVLVDGWQLLIGSLAQSFY